MILSRSWSSVLYILAWGSNTVFLLSCTNSTDPTQATPIDSTAYLMEREELSLKYCQSCHLYTLPELLPKHIWKNEVLPRMGAFSGIYEKESREALLEGGRCQTHVNSG